MNKIIGNLLYVCSEIWKSIGMAQKASIVLIALAGIIGTVVVIGMSMRQDWHVLYANMDPETAAKVYELVRDDNVPVQLRDSGRTIMVPFKHVYDLRLRVAESNIDIARRGVGWELFDNVKLGMTEQQQKVGFQRAMQGELERMIGEMPGVSSAKLMINIPEERIFRRGEPQRPRASVLLVLRPGHTLPPAVVSSIRHLVASGVQGMDSSDVTVTDNNGRLLARQRSESENEGGDPNSQLETQIRIEQMLKDKAEAILWPIVGADNVVAMVTAELDFNQVDKVMERYAADQTVLISERVSSDEGVSRNAREAAGAVGTSANIPVANPAEGSELAGARSSQSMRRTTENQYMVPKTTERVTIRGARVVGISVAVTLGRKDDGEAREPAQIEQYRNLVASAVGTSAERVHIVETTFRPTQLAGPSFDMQVPVLDRVAWNVERWTTSPLVRPLVAIVLLMVLYRIFKVNFDRERVESTDLSGGGMLDDGDDRVYSVGPAEERHALAEAPIADPDLEMVLASADDNPDAVANALESWLLGEKKTS